MDAGRETLIYVLLVVSHYLACVHLCETAVIKKIQMMNFELIAGGGSVKVKLVLQFHTGLF